MNHPVPADPPAHPEWRTRRPHPLELPPEAVRTLRDLSVTAAQELARTSQFSARPPEVVLHRREPERIGLWPHLGRMAAGILLVLACIGILALGYIAIMGFVAWGSR